jgi:hypothetical protein
MLEAEHSSKPIHKGEWKAASMTDEQQAQGKRYLDSYNELVDKYDERNLLFFVWEFAEQSIRLIILTFAPPLIAGGGFPLPLQLLALVCFTIFSLVVLIRRDPYREVNANYLKIVGKLIELVSFVLLILAGVMPFVSPGTSPDSYTSLVMWINIAYVFAMLANTLKDNFLMVKQVAKRLYGKKQDCVAPTAAKAKTLATRHDPMFTSSATRI